jgi:hypothetical protein
MRTAPARDRFRQGGLNLGRNERASGRERDEHGAPEISQRDRGKWRYFTSVSDAYRAENMASLRL